MEQFPLLTVLSVLLPVGKKLYFLIIPDVCLRSWGQISSCISGYSHMAVTMPPPEFFAPWDKYTGHVPKMSAFNLSTAPSGTVGTCSLMIIINSSKVVFCSCSSPQHLFGDSWTSPHMSHTLVYFHFLPEMSKKGCQLPSSLMEATAQPPNDQSF